VTQAPAQQTPRQRVDAFEKELYNCVREHSGYLATRPDVAALLSDVSSTCKQGEIALIFANYKNIITTFDKKDPENQWKGIPRIQPGPYVLNPQGSKKQNHAKPKHCTFNQPSQNVIAKILRRPANCQEVKSNAVPDNSWHDWTLLILPGVFYKVSHPLHQSTLIDRSR